MTYQLQYKTSNLLQMRTVFGIPDYNIAVMYMVRQTHYIKLKREEIVGKGSF